MSKFTDNPIPMKQKQMLWFLTTLIAPFSIYSVYVAVKHIEPDKYDFDLMFYDFHRYDYIRATGINESGMSEDQQLLFKVTVLGRQMAENYRQQV